MDESRKVDLLNQYGVVARVYRDLAESTAGLIEHILRQAAISVHSITYRAKEPDSLDGKLSRPDKQYERLGEVTDLAGVRVITYFAADVDRVASVIEREFAIDKENSIDKRAVLDPDRFGYLSLHYVASISDERAQLPEYARLQALKVEIQVRSILQHSWAEIEHDLGYKSKAGVPREIQRRFARVAGLLELADVEFEGIRTELAAYAAAVPAAIQSTPDDVTIDKISLQSYIKATDSAKQLDHLSCTILNARLVDPQGTFLDRLATRIQSVGIVTIADLSKEVEKYSTVAEPFIRSLFGKVKSHELSRGIGLHHMIYALVASRGYDAVRKFLDEHNIEPEERRDSFARRIIKAYADAGTDGSQQISAT